MTRIKLIIKYDRMKEKNGEKSISFQKLSFPFTYTYIHTCIYVCACILVGACLYFQKPSPSPGKLQHNQGTAGLKTGFLLINQLRYQS